MASVISSTGSTPEKGRYRLKNEHVYLDDLVISFRRTVKIPDNKHLSELPPSLGCFPLFKVEDYANRLPADMAAKGGLLIPMYQRESMWINFSSVKRYAVKIIVGGVNAISGEPEIATAATALRRRKRLSEGESIQDYIVVPDQYWLDGVAVSPHEDVKLEDPDIMLIVQSPLGSALSVPVAHSWTVSDLKAELYARDGRLIPHKQGLVVLHGKRLLRDSDVLVNCGIAHETKLKVSLQGRKDGFRNVYVKTPKDAWAHVTVRPSDTVYALKKLLEGKEGIPAEQQRLVFSGQTLDDTKTMSCYNITEGSMLQILLRVVGGVVPGVRSKRARSPTKPVTGYEMNLAPGGRMKQNIVRDDSSGRWEVGKTETFNIQILDTVSFMQVTGRRAPSTPVSASTYAMHGLPFYHLEEGSTDVAGNFKNLKSIAEIDGKEDPDVKQRVMPVVKHIPLRTELGPGFFNPAGPAAEFYSADDMARLLGQAKYVAFK
ncbi:hypothetical protein QBC34DRAFT_425823 [Podospora aff. communis PSN243]|uniref:Ubiquitin-like domain-containing protein n=1 Tax=Podospora aff. communis PSN243 TaxID=3040156 RepID=A0AAV9GLG0_9PEZI|nr:hypothetical protein QBC34DRAFT_425823 [Podospora aff. communis PSN243]